MRSTWLRLAASAILLVGVAGCVTAIVPRPIEGGPESDPLCTDRIGVGGFDCPPPSPGVEPSVSTGGSIGSNPRNLREAALSDLYDLRAKQSEYFRLHNEYSRWTDELDFDASSGVSVQILRATRTGWSALARVRSLQLECAIFDGSVATPRAYVTQRGVAECQR